MISSSVLACVLFIVPVLELSCMALQLYWITHVRRAVTCGSSCGVCGMRRLSYDGHSLISVRWLKKIGRSGSGV